MLKLYASLPSEVRSKLLSDVAREVGLDREALEAQLSFDWRIIGRPKQQPPADDDWVYWFIRAGRGFGKTLSAAQWARTMALDHPGCRFALVAPTFGDGRDTMVEGETGLLNVLRDHELKGGERSTAYNRSNGELELANGSRFKVFSSEQPDRLRGPQHHFAWGEEISSWRDANKGDELETTWSNVKLGTRLGDAPKVVLTSTPKPNKLTKALLAIPAPVMRMVTGSSYENRDNLSEVWWGQVIEPYEGTRLGRQEIHAELLDDVEGALWRLAQIEALRVYTVPAFQRVVIGVDPNASSGEAANSAGIIAAGLGHFDKHAYILGDHTITRGGPAAWAAAAVDAYHQWDADLIVAEANQGGEMVKMVIRTVDATVPIRLVHATRGKRVRAEPLAVLYDGSETNEERSEPGKVHHVGVFTELEDEMVTWTPDAESPDRMDALVWALTELMLKHPGGGKILQPTGRIPGIGTGRQAILPQF